MFRRGKSALAQILHDQSARKLCRIVSLTSGVFVQSSLKRFVIIGLLAAPVIASAGTYTLDVDYSGSGFAADLVLTTTQTPVAGELTVLSISGERNGVAVDGLLPADTYGMNDNLFPVENFGIAYSAGGIDYNFYADGGALGSPTGFDECSSASTTCPYTNDGVIVTSYSVRAVASAPEVDPSSAIAGLTLLFGALAVVRGRRPSGLAA
jgi:hypothetical protein